MVLVDYIGILLHVAVVVLILRLLWFFLLNFGIVPTVWYFFVLHFIIMCWGEQEKRSKQKKGCGIQITEALEGQYLLLQ
jgi:hypothetical protein